MLNYILIGIGILFILLSISALGMGVNVDESESAPAQFGQFIASLIIAVPFFTLGSVLLAVGLLRKSKEKKIKEIKFGCKCCRCSNCSLEHNHWTHD